MKLSRVVGAIKAGCQSTAIDRETSLAVLNRKLPASGTLGKKDETPSQRLGTPE